MTIEDDELSALFENISEPKRTKLINLVKKQRAARVRAKNIPNWATWTEEQAYTWGMDNIGTPLANGRANLPTTLTLATARIAILQIITILDAIWTMLWALCRISIAMRDHIWPDLPDT